MKLARARSMTPCPGTSSGPRAIAGAQLAPLLALLEDRHETRVETDPDFAYLEAMVERARARSARNRLPLQEAQRRAGAGGG
jgi:hypothetical protein